MRARKDSGGGGSVDGVTALEGHKAPLTHHCGLSRLLSAMGVVILTFYLLNSFTVHNTTNTLYSLRRHPRYRVMGQYYAERDELARSVIEDANSLQLMLAGPRDQNNSLVVTDVEGGGAGPQEGVGKDGLLPPAGPGVTTRTEDDVASGLCLKLWDNTWHKVPCGGPPESKTGEEDPDLKWCREAQQRHQVQVGRSWGSLDGTGQKRWETTGCNGIIELGRKMSCDEVNGLKYLLSWREGSEVLVGQDTTTQDMTTTRAVCADNYIHAQSCTYQNVMVDFGKAQVQADSRDTLEGFLLVDGEIHGRRPEFPHGIVSKPGVLSTCKEWEEDVTFVMAHDDIFNYGHFLADAWNVWLAGELHHLPWGRMKLINMDGIAGNGPAGGQNRMKRPGSPDYLSVFFDLYRSWFGRGVEQAVDYGSRKVCFRNIIFQPHPGAGHIWSDFSYLSECSIKGPSWLYQGYNRHVRAKLFGEDFASHPPRPSRPQVTFIRRRLNEKVMAGKSLAARARTVANERELYDALRSIPGVEVVFQDFADTPFLQQTQVIQNTSVLMGFHGAGMAHVMQLPIGSPRCCAVVELTSEGFHQLNQFGNFARYLGMPFFRWEARDMSKYQEGGTVVDVEAIKKLVVEAVAALPP